MTPENDAALSDDQIRSMGYRPTPRGWAPTRPSAMIPDPQLPEPEKLEIPPELPPNVKIVRRFRKAARAVVRSGSGDERGRFVALAELAEAARRSPVPEIAQRAIWTEAKGFITGEPETEIRPLVDPVENAIRRMLRDGYVRCPQCRRLLGDERELDRQRRRRLAEIEEARRFEEAVE